jgi:ribosome-interacting GTPase 1
MPANLPPQYHEAEKRYRAARTIPEKVAALQEMLAVMPKHKGTDHLKADLRAKVAKLMDDLERPAASRGGRPSPFAIRKEGAGQAVLVGPPNSGKSSLLAALTGAKVKVAPYPFTTQVPEPGMLPFENTHIQVVDTPPLSEGRLESRVFGLLRNSDVLVAVVDLGASPVTQVEALLGVLRQWGIQPLAMGEDAEPSRRQTEKRLVIAANKADLEGALDAFQQFIAHCGQHFPVVLTSATEAVGLEDLGREIFKSLGVIRVYTAPPGSEPSLENPLVLPQGSTVKDAATSIHKEWQRKLKYARVWGSATFDGQRVGRDYVLADGDVLQLHGQG